jgi:peptidoglycan/LPS O-acetylase OafA/YrhL
MKMDFDLMNSQHSLKPRTQISALTSLRGIAAVWVMLFHIDVIIFYRELGSLIPHDVSGILTKGYLWVDFFFLLSGFIMSHVYGEIFHQKFAHWQSIKTFLWVRLSRIYPLHLFTLILLLPMALLFPIFSPKVADGSWTTFFAWSAIWDNLVLINAMDQHNYLSWNIVSWSIGAEWWTYVAACFILPFVYQKKNFQMLLTSIFAIAVLGALVYFKKNLDITFDYGWLRCLAEFCLGTVIYQLYLKKSGIKWLSKDIFFIVVLLLIISIFHCKWNDLLIIPLFCGLLLAVGYNESRIKSLLAFRLFNYLGEISYSIYMMHGVFFMVFWFGLPYLKSEFGIMQMTIGMKILYLFSFLGLTILSAHFTYRTVEVKARKWMRRLL